MTTKAYIISETEVLDAAAFAAVVPLVLAATVAAGGRTLHTGQGRIVALEGPPPKRVVMIEWDSLEQAQAWRNSAAYKNLQAPLGKAVKTIRSYIVEAVAK